MARPIRFVMRATIPLAFALTFAVDVAHGQTPGADSPSKSAVKKSSDESIPVIMARPHQVGYRRVVFPYKSTSGEERKRQLDFWYPTSEKEQKHNYGGQVGFAAKDAPVAPGKHPLLLFSHGYLSVSDQSIFITESCARAGYIVASMNHKDSLFNRGETRNGAPRFGEPGSWSDEKYHDRGEDLRTLLDQFHEWNKTSDSPWNSHIATDAIGAMGHSLGGYTVIGLVGGWPSWKDARIKAVVAYSPYVQPYEVGGKLEDVTTPVMLQGGTFDFGISPFLPGTYKKLGGPKSHLVLKKENHFGWSNLISLNKTTTECVSSGNAELMVKYTIAFFDQHLLGSDQSKILEKTDERLESYSFKRK